MSTESSQTPEMKFTFPQAAETVQEDKEEKNNSSSSASSLGSNSSSAR